MARGFGSVAEHDESVVTRWNSVVGPNDVVIHCGDFFLTDGDGAKAKRILPRLNGTIYYVWGNHNSGMKVIYAEAAQGFPAGVEVYPLVAGNVVFVGHKFDFVHKGKRVVATHFPLATWEDIAKGSYNVSGHEHGGFEGSLPTNLTKRCLDVGVDVFGAPVPFDTVIEIMNHKNILSVGHHGE